MTTEKQENNHQLSPLLSIAALPSNPLFSIATTSSVLAIIYLPRTLHRLIFLSVFLLFVTLIILCLPKETETQFPEPDRKPKLSAIDDEPAAYPNPRRRAWGGFSGDQTAQRVRIGDPLEVIYEEEEDHHCEGGDSGFSSDSSESEGFSAEAHEGWWEWRPEDDEDEEEEEGMIEIALNVDEDLMEIDISKEQLEQDG